MLKINETDCLVESATIKFGHYKTMNENFKEVIPTDSFPLIIMVKFKEGGRNGYFRVDMENFKDENFSNLANKEFKGTFEPRNSKFSFFDLSFQDRYSDAFDIETNITLTFGNIIEGEIETTIQIISEDHDLFFEGNLTIQKTKGENL